MRIINKQRSGFLRQDEALNKLKYIYAFDLLLNFIFSLMFSKCVKTMSLKYGKNYTALLCHQLHTHFLSKLAGRRLSVVWKIHSIFEDKKSTHLLNILGPLQGSQTFRNMLKHRSHANTTQK